MHMRGSWKLLVCTPVALCAFWWPGAGSAVALEPVIEENIPTINEHLRRGATYWTPTDCGTACQRLWLRERETAPNGWRRLPRELFKLRTRIGAISFARFAVGGLLGAVATTIIVKVGGKLLSFDRPEKGSGASAQRLTAYQTGDPLTVGYHPLPTVTYTFPEPGFAWEHQVGPSNWHSQTSTDPNCSGPSVPSSLHVLSPGTYNICGDPFTDLGPGTVTGGYIHYWELVNSIEDYVAQPYDDTADPLLDPGESATEDELLDQLEERPEEYRVPEADWAEEFDPQNHDLGTKENEPCDLSGGANEDPGLGRGSGGTGDDFLRRYDKVPGAIAPTTGFPAVNGQTYLRWGVTTPNVDNSEIDWRGWGYRKIAAKHGWSASDLAATTTALLDPTPDADAREPERDRYTYIGPEYDGDNGAVCVRTVVVEYGLSDDDIFNGATVPAGIITSFGKRIG